MKKDTLFKDTLEKSVNQYLDTMLEHKDIEVRSGVKAVKEYIEILKKENKILEESNQLKDQYLKQMKSKS